MKTIFEWIAGFVLITATIVAIEGLAYKLTGQEQKVNAHLSEFFLKIPSNNYTNSIVECPRWLKDYNLGTTNKISVCMKNGKLMEVSDEPRLIP